jgi:hypothetical protein
MYTSLRIFDWFHFVIFSIARNEIVYYFRKKNWPTNLEAKGID